MPNKIEYKSGDIIGGCLFLRDAGKESKRRMAIFRCNCGNDFRAEIFNVKSKKIISCGCRLWDQEKSRLSSIRHTTHGLTGSKEYNSWQAMKTRCLTNGHQTYESYGAKGISICERWVDSFESFLEDMGKAPSPLHTIDRFPDKKGNYEPGNCRWADKIEQANNTSKTIFLTCYGLTESLTYWSKRVRISKSGIKRRLDVGWTTLEALSIPLVSRSKRGVYKKENPINYAFGLM
jgi:hypothetical protein